jgi:hypothetical protein
MLRSAVMIPVVAANPSISLSPSAPQQAGLLSMETTPTCG